MDEIKTGEKIQPDSPQKTVPGNETEGGVKELDPDKIPEPAEKISSDNPCDSTTVINPLPDVNFEEKSNDSTPGEESTSSIPQIITRRSRSSSKDESVIKLNSVCKHESNKFQIHKRRFRCADCKLIACPECFAIGASSLNRHLHDISTENYKIFPCSLCDLHFLSNCALQAHIRIHMLDSPYVCPDCGCVYSNIYYLSLHLINKCYHVYKLMRFRCSVCQYSYKGADAFSDHIKNVHIKSMVKCSECDSMFDDVEGFQKHASSMHKDNPAKKDLYIRCSLCSCSAMTKSQEAEHIKYHRDHPVSHQFIYACSCGANFNSTNSFRTHSNTCRKKGILPPQWNYLQTKMKAQELALGRNAEREDLTSPDSLDPNFCINCGEELTEDETCQSCTDQEPTEKQQSLEISQNRDSVTIKIKDSINKKIEELLNGESDVIVLDEKSKDAKNFYDHVPNDHLGYLKTHEEDKGKGSKGQYQIETVLDEETGVLKSSKVWVDPKKIEDDDDEIREIPVEKEGTPTTYADFKKKYKDSFFSCPFCNTLFFKHESSFQKFLLHIECYHNDAGIDVIADKNEYEKVKKTVVVIRSDDESEEEKTEIFRPRVIHEDEQVITLPKKKKMTLLKITTPPVKKKKNFFEPEKNKTDKVVLNRRMLYPALKKIQNGAEEESNESLKKESDKDDSDQGFRLRRRLPEETPKKDAEVWEEFYQSLHNAEKLRLKRKKAGEDEQIPLNSDYQSKRVVKKPKRYQESSGDESGSELEKIKTPEKSKTPSPEKTKTPTLEEPKPVEKKLVDQKFTNELFDFVEKNQTEKQTDLYKKHSNLRLNPKLPDYRQNVLNGIKIRGRPRKHFPSGLTASGKKRGRPRKNSINSPVKNNQGSDYDDEVNFIEKNFESEENDSSKRKRKLSSKIQFYQKVSDSEFSSGQLINSKASGGYRKLTCAVCKESLPNLSEFREHIMSHRMDDNTYQCMECGECFVVRPSLAKHLHAFHKIKDIDKYIKENNCSEKEEPEPEPEPLKENQCKVCKDIFDCPGDLSKHFRIHGMAFLKEFKKESAKEDPQKKEIGKKEEGLQKVTITSKGTGNKELTKEEKEALLKTNSKITVKKELSKEEIERLLKKEVTMTKVPKVELPKDVKEILPTERTSKGTGNVGNF